MKDSKKQEDRRAEGVCKGGGEKLRTVDRERVNEEL